MKSKTNKNAGFLRGTRIEVAYNHVGPQSFRVHAQGRLRASDEIVINDFKVGLASRALESAHCTYSVSGTTSARKPNWRKNAQPVTFDATGAKLADGTSLSHGKQLILSPEGYFVIL